MTKTGMEMTTSVETRTRLSRNPFLRIPVSTPARTPSTVSNAMAMRASFSVTGYLTLSWSATAMPL